MTIQKLYDSMDGLFAYDTGCVDSGIRDEVLRQEVIKHLRNLDPVEFRVVLSNYVREYFISKEAIEQGYGIEDVKSFIEWLEEMGIGI